jgi:hypothetical protein
MSKNKKPLSIGGALAAGTPVVFTTEGCIPEVVCVEGKEKEALELLHSMKLIKLIRPIRS